MISSRSHINVEFKSCQIKFEYLPSSQLQSVVWYSFDIWKYFVCHFALKDYICVMLGFVSAYLHMMKDCMKYKTKLKNLWKWFDKYKKKSKHARVRSVPSRHICKFICGFGWNKVKAGDHSFRVLLWFLAALTLHEMNLRMNQVRLCPSPRALLCLYHPPQWSPHCPRLRKC